MAVTQISICNSALIKVGADRISSITQETKSAQLLNALWDQTRDAVLRAHPWNFATKRETISPTEDEPEYEYDYKYDIPSDCLRILDEQYSDTDYVIEGRKILSNETELNIRYIWRNEDENEWDACFAEAMAWKLAEQIAYALTQSSTLVDQCSKSYRAAIAEARSMDGAEGILKGLEADTWTRARR